ncbi:MAG: hypothetical protein AAGA18_08215 [Verrucomicrobiota bacterium]
MSNTDSIKVESRPSAWLPLILILVALAGFLGTTYWTQNREFAALNQTLEDTKKSLVSQITEQNDLLNKRYMAMMKLSQEVSVHETVLNEVQHTIKIQKVTHENKLAELKSDLKLVKDEGAAVVAVLDKRVDGLVVKSKAHSNSVDQIQNSLDEKLSEKDKLLSRLETDIKNLTVLVNNQAAEIRSLRGALAAKGIPTPDLRTAQSQAKSPSEGMNSSSPRTVDEAATTQTTIQQAVLPHTNRYSWNDFK